MREKCAKKVRESQGIQIELTGGNPDVAISVNCSVQNQLQKAVPVLDILDQEGPGSCG